MNMRFRSPIRDAFLAGLIFAARSPALADPTPPAKPTSASIAADPFAAGCMRGVCWEAVGRIDRSRLRPVHDLGANWISQTPFGWCSGQGAAEVRLATKRVWWGESDSGLVQTAAWARALGMRTLLKPHLWVRHGQWVGDLAMASEADWQRWFASYQEFIVHYARLAAAAGFDALAIGTELAATTHRSADWRRIIAAVRAVYPGPITYCANWSQETQRIEFWQDLDFIGVQAYYPLTKSNRASVADIRRAWEPHARELEELARRTAKRVVFTEIGYKSVAGALEKPWIWNVDGEVDVGLQRDAYRALFETFWRQPWFGGTFIWKWHPDWSPDDARAARDFTPQGKPALAVIQSYYTAPDAHGGAASNNAGP